MFRLSVTANGKFLSVNFKGKKFKTLKVKSKILFAALVSRVTSKMLFMKLLFHIPSNFITISSIEDSGE